MKIVFDKSANQKINVFCHNCKCSTKHFILKSVDTSGKESFEYDDYIYWEETFQIIQCLGCETISFRKESSNSEDIDPRYGPIINEELFPKRSNETLIAKNFLNTPYNLKRIYKETIDCYNNDILTLSAAGLRALVEGICNEKYISDGPISDPNGKIRRKDTLQGKINGLSEKGLLTADHAKILQDYRFLGNKALHQLSMPEKEGLVIAIHIIEHILESIFELPVQTRAFRAKINKESTS